MDGLPGQVASTLLDGRVVLSSARVLHEGARGAVLLQPGAFRLDVSVTADVVRVVALELGPHTVSVRGSGYAGTLACDGQWLETQLAGAGRHDLTVTAGPVSADVVLATLRERDTGLARCTAQAVITCAS